MITSVTKITKVQGQLCWSHIHDVEGYIIDGEFNGNSDIIEVTLRRSDGVEITAAIPYLIIQALGHMAAQRVHFQSGST